MLKRDEVKQEEHRIIFSNGKMTQRNKDDFALLTLTTVLPMSWEEWMEIVAVYADMMLHGND